MKPLIILLFIILLVSCSPTTEERFYVVVVEGKEKIFDQFEDLASVRNPIIEIDYFRKVEDAKERLPEYEMEQTPVVFIFIMNEGKELQLKTTDIDESIRFLNQLKTS
ncbi:hypothetical protein GMD78_06060 [Ornithinibacillus sp. L9]|uniref:Small peptidoglycan-associated lipoprotein n=1 Tax=Ornithinibacillus caprae TaxID=2678566 RepID=A0A6N8FFI0_9BACI|nr:hypothetical protein [Ornithinibacillus caprae]MUK87961.1 hypothetical protein [Ornithinibacillus caprae]